MDAQEFADSLKGELVDEEVYVFTPKGEVKRLAAGATPLDFAYEVHTDVGHRCVGSRVNNKIKHWFKQESRVDSEHTGRELLQEHLKKAGLPHQKVTGSAMMADVIREM